MKGIIRFIKKLFGIYESGYEYWVHTRILILILLGKKPKSIEIS